MPQVVGTNSLLRSVCLDTEGSWLFTVHSSVSFWAKTWLGKASSLGPQELVVLRETAFPLLVMKETQKLAVTISKLEYPV